MRRFHLFEFEDQPWFPGVIRDAGTTYLELMARLARIGEVMALILVPFLRPFRWSWIPLFIFWDGFVSCLRCYSQDGLRVMTADLSSDAYQSMGNWRPRHTRCPLQGPLRDRVTDA